MTLHDDVSPAIPSPLSWAEFVSPPDEARPRVWWHWMDGNIDPAGIVRDLTWLHRIGVRGVQLFDGGMGMPLVVPEAVRPGSPAWTEAVDTAVRTAAELGLELAVATSSGWSAAGGPWVQPADAMKKVVWSETILDAGGLVDVALAPLPSVAGLYQDTPRWGAPEREPFAADWVVLALPHDESLDVLRPASVTASGPVADPGVLTDGSFAGALSLPRDPDAWSEAWIEQAFDAPVTVRSVVAGLPGPRGFGAAPPPEAVLEAADEDGIFREVARLDVTTVPARSATFPPVTARRFRLRLSAGSAADALPPREEGVRMPPVLRRADAFLVSQFALRTGARVHHAETKAGFGVVADYYAVDTDPSAEAGVTPASAVVDVTALVTEGRLRWDAPPGRWRILRLGASLTGQTNGPAPADSTGLEVDKLDGRRVAEYLAAHLPRFGDDAGPAGRTTSRFQALLSDSIESGPQNVTDRLREQFTARRGYDPLRWLPALTGLIVESPASSDAFLYDYRRTLAELFAQEYYGTLGAEARRRGLSYYAEALEDRRPQLGDDLAMRAHADVPMGAMWTFSPEDGPLPTYVADLKGASSVAHVHGKAWTGSEAFTSFGRPWSWSPQSLKHIADLQLALGVTRFCIHTSPHQPLAAPPPGIALAPFLGQALTVAETWADMAGPWIDYLARCSAVLSLGRPDVDIAVFVGEEAPVTGLFGARPDETAPDGHDIDYIGADALHDVLRVRDGRVEADGADYAVLHLGGSSSRLTLRALTDIERLVDAGATVVGPRPTGSPSLADDPGEVAALCARLWETGRVMDAPLAEALRAIGLSPAWEVAGGAVRRISRRLDDGGRLLFLANPGSDGVELRVRSASGGDLQAWDPVLLTRRPLPAASDGTVTVPLAPFGSVFLLPAGAGSGPAAPSRVAAPLSAGSVPLAGTWRVEVPGAAPRETSPWPRPWTEAGPLERGFSGTAVYRHEFALTAEQAAAAQAIEFDAVDDIARVVLNGRDCGIVWTAPFRAVVTDAAREGRNELAVHVATPWRNRLIAEGASPSGEIFGPMTQVFEPSAAPMRAGLGGEVRLVTAPEPAADGGSAGR